jgi:putative endonuclease
MKQYYVYILTNKRNGTLYIGVTNNLEKRVQEHKSKTIQGFTQKYNVTLLVYYELYSEIYLALQREKALKKWDRSWKLKLIDFANPKWVEIKTGFPPPRE